jgi:hypothetical protein
MAARFASGTDALAAAVRERQDTLQRWQATDRALLKALSQPVETRSAKAEAALRRELQALDRRLSELDARLAREY